MGKLSALAIFTIVFITAVIGCGSSPTEDNLALPEDLPMQVTDEAETPPAAPDSVIGVENEEPAPSPTSVVFVEDGDRGAVFLASVESLVSETVWEGTLFANPEEYIAGAQELCVRLGSGDSTEELMVSKVEAISGGSLADSTDADRLLAGALMGAGVGTYCPEYAGLL